MPWSVSLCPDTTYGPSLRLAHGASTHSRRTGFDTLPNSSTPILPPGLSTRCASLSTAGIDRQLRMPNAIVYRSIELSGMCEGSDWALPCVKDICGATERQLRALGPRAAPHSLL